MNKSFLLDLLVDPISKESFQYDAVKNLLVCPISKNEYPVVESVPKIILNENDAISKSSIHNQFNSPFRYIDHYQKDAEIFDYLENSIPKASKFELKRLREAIVNEIPGDGEIVLDVGCGGGWLSEKIIPLGKKVISMDISTKNPINAVKRLKHENHAGLIADVYNIPLRENSIDCIVASEILEHVSDPEVFILKLLGVLKSNGKLIITTPYNEKLEYSLCVHCNRLTPKSAHLHSFNESNIDRFLPKKGISRSIRIFSNKYLAKIQPHLFISFFSFRLWLLLDKLFNKLIYKPCRLQLMIRKNNS